MAEQDRGLLSNPEPPMAGEIPPAASSEHPYMQPTAKPVAVNSTVGDPYAAAPAVATAPTGGIVAGQPVLHHLGPADPYATGAGPTIAKEEPQHESGYRDVPWLVAFFIHLVVIVILCFAMGVPALNEAAKASSGQVVDPSVTTDTVSKKVIVGILVVAALAGGVSSAAWLLFLKSNAEGVIKCSLYTSVVVQVIGAIVLLTYSVFGGILMLLGALACGYYAYIVKNRIPFASANLKTAIAAVNKYPTTVFVAFAGLLAQFVWVVIWGVAFYGVNSKSEGDGWIGEIFMLVSLYWGQQVIQNIVHCTVSGTVASWWFRGDVGGSPVADAMRRACTTSLGSIALGALIVAILKTIRTLAEQARRRSRDQGGITAFAACCLVCILRQIERLMEYFNKWAFCYVAIYGHDFRTAGNKVTKLFRERGWTTVINDDLINTALFIGCIVVGVATGLIGAGWAAASQGTSSSWVFSAAFVSFLIGVFMCMITSAVIISAVATIIVCFAQNPEALGSTHPDEQRDLVNAWLQFRPEEMAACGYSARFGAGPAAI